MPDIGTILSIAATIAIAWLGYWWNQITHHNQKNYLQKDESYRNLTKCLPGFYRQSIDKELQRQFLEQLNFCWLYAPEEVIRKGNAFLESQRRGADLTNEQREKIVGELLLEIRRDLLSRKVAKSGNLSSHDYKHIAVSSD